MDFWDGTRWTADPSAPAAKTSRPRRRLLGAAAEASLITLLMFGLIAGTTLAAKGGNGGGKGGGGKPPRTNGSATITLVLVQDTSGNGAPDHGDTVTFEIVTKATEYPYLSVRCFQAETLVYAADAGFYPDYPWPGAQQMPLSSPAWTGGAASCSAVLNDGLARYDFLVGP